MNLKDQLEVVWRKVILEAGIASRAAARKIDEACPIVADRYFPCHRIGDAFPVIRLPVIRQMLVETGCEEQPERAELIVQLSKEIGSGG